MTAVWNGKQFAIKRDENTTYDRITVKAEGNMRNLMGLFTETQIPSFLDENNTFRI